MTEPIIVRVFDIIGGPLALCTSDGQRLYDKIAPLLTTGAPVVLSFKRVNVLIPAFLNAAVGQLYGKMSENRIRELLSVRDLDAGNFEVLNCVIDNAKAYFSRPKDFDRAWQEELDEE